MLRTTCSASDLEWTLQLDCRRTPTCSAEPEPPGQPTGSPWRRLWALAQHFLQQRIRDLGVGLRCSFLDVRHQRAQRLLLACSVILDSSWVGRDYGLDHSFDRCFIAVLCEPSLR